MPDSEDFQSETLDEAEAQLPDDHPVLRALRREREARKQAEAQAQEAREAAQRSRFGELKSRFPFLKEDHLKGREPSEWEAWAEELNELRGNAPRAQDGEKVETEPVTHPEEQDFAKAQELGGGQPADGKGQTYSPSEIRNIGLRDQALALKLIQEGRMRSP